MEKEQGYQIQKTLSKIKALGSRLGYVSLGRLFHFLKPSFPWETAHALPTWHSSWQIYSKRFSSLLIPKSSYHKDDLICKRFLVSQVKVSFKLRLNDVQRHEDGCKAGTPNLLLFPSKEQFPILILLVLYNIVIMAPLSRVCVILGKLLHLFIS